jgi:hypothetical protein
MQSVEGGYGATVGETGPEEPGVLIVPRDYAPIFFKNRLHLSGRPQMSTHPSQKSGAGDFPMCAAGLEPATRPL